MEEIRIKLNEEVVRLGRILDDPRECNDVLIRGQIQGLIFSLKLLPVTTVKSVVLDLVSKCCDGHIEERDLYKNTITGQLFCAKCNKVLFDNGVKEERFELNEGLGETVTSDTVATITTNHSKLIDDVPKEWRR